MSTGLPVSELWNQLAEQATAIGSPNVSQMLRCALWRRLSERQIDISCVVSSTAATEAPQQPPPLPPQQQEQEQEQEREQITTTIPWTAPAAASHTAAEAAGLRLVAIPALQDAALGVYGARLDRFQLSVTQRKTLKLLGKAKQQGELQSVLANKLKIGPGSCSSVLKNLEERGLITRCPTVLHRGGGVVINTNFVLLTKFAPKDIIHPGARISDNRSSTMTQGVPLPGAAPTMANYDFANNGDSGGDGSGDDHMDMDMDDDGDEDENMMTRGVGDPSPTSAAAAAGTLHVVNDDEVYLRAITSRLASAPDQTMRESLLKQALGYTGTPKQRQWSRFRSILEKKKVCEDTLSQHGRGLQRPNWPALHCHQIVERMGG